MPHQFYSSALTEIFSAPLRHLEAQRLPDGVLAIRLEAIELRAHQRNGHVQALCTNSQIYAVEDAERCDLICQLAERVLTRQAQAAFLDGR